MTLCRPCHQRYDAHELDLYPLLPDRKLLGAVRAAGSAGEALRRLMGASFRTSPDLTLQRRLERLEALHEHHRASERDEV